MNIIVNSVLQLKCYFNFFNNSFLKKRYRLVPVVLFFHHPFPHQLHFPFLKKKKESYKISLKHLNQITGHE